MPIRSLPGIVESLRMEYGHSDRDSDSGDNNGNSRDDGDGSDTDANIDDNGNNQDTAPLTAAINLANDADDSDVKLPTALHQP